MDVNQDGSYDLVNGWILKISCCYRPRFLRRAFHKIGHQGAKFRHSLMENPILLNQLKRFQSRQVENKHLPDWEWEWLGRSCLLPKPAVVGWKTWNRKTVKERFCQYMGRVVSKHFNGAYPMVRSVRLLTWRMFRSYGYERNWRYSYWGKDLIDKITTYQWPLTENSKPAKFIN